MPNGNITKKQMEIYEYLKKEILSKGYPPAIREICEAVNLKSTSSVHSHLESLEKNGYIKGDEKGRKMYKKFMTREEMITVLYRILKDKSLI